MKGAEQFIYLQLQVGVGINLTLIPVIPPIHTVLTRVHQHSSGPPATS